MKKYFAILSLLLVMAMFAGCSMMPTIAPVDEKETTTPAVDLFNYDGLDYSQNEILVRAASYVSLETMMAKAGSRVIEEWPQVGWAAVSVPAGETPLSFIETLRSTKGILLAEPNMQYHVDVAATAPRYDEQWGFDNINAEAAWDITTGDPNVIVAIVDTGVDQTHPEFADKTFIDAYDATGEGLPEIDLGDHGTHVAGIAADDGRNGQISGVAWDCPIMPVRVENSNGSIWTTYLIEGMIHLGDYAAAHPEYRIVANMSIGGRGYNFAFKDAIDYAAANGVLLITSAGNDTKRIVSYPSAYNGVVSVAASTPYDVKADFSTIGWWNSVAAPGVKILSTVPGELYESWQGTSMASPYVTGAAALLLSKNPTLTPLQIKNQIEQTARGNGFSEELGYGVLDVEALLGELQPMQYGSLNVTSNIISTPELGWIGAGIVTVFDANNTLVGFGTTGESGNYLFHALKPGNYTVNISYYDLFADQYCLDSKTVTVAIDSTATVDFVVTVPTQINRTSVYAEDIIESTGSYEIPVTIVVESFYEMETSFYTADCDTVLYLCDADGNLLATNDDFADRYSYIGRVLTPGDYIIVVEEFSGLELNAHFEMYQTQVVY